MNSRGMKVIKWLLCLIGAHSSAYVPRDIYRASGDRLRCLWCGVEYFQSGDGQTRIYYKLEQP